MSNTAFDAWVHAELQRVEAALSRWVPADAPAGLGLAMRYGVLDGGKRLRPLLVRAACEAVDGDLAAALRAAVASTTSRWPPRLSAGSTSRTARARTRSPSLSLVRSSRSAPRAPMKKR